MRKSGPRAPRLGSNALRTIAPRPLLERILETPHFAQVIPRLQPGVLHRVIEACGLADCGEIVALATPAQLARVFDLDLWRADGPGLDEQFDPDRFGLWMEVLVGSGEALAAQKLAQMDVHLLTTAFAEHAYVFDIAAVAPLTLSDGDEPIAMPTQDDELSCEIGGYKVVARRTGSWDAIIAALMALDAQHQAFFHRLMGGCRSLSNSKPEVDGLDDLLAVRDQRAFDLGSARERRREQQGFATPAEARAFLQASRQISLGRGSAPPASPTSRAYFRAVEEPGEDPTPEQEESVDAGAIVELLLDAGVLPQPPRALLGAPRDEARPAERLGRIKAHMQAAHDKSAVLYATRSQELAYLVNTMVAGCSVQARSLTPQEASDAAVGVCNLGLENWPAAWPPAEELVSVFQVGWAVLYERVCLDAASRLVAVLRHLRCEDRDIQSALIALRVAMAKQRKAGTPWLAHDELDAITFLDMPAWAALSGLIAEFPVMHAALAASAGSGKRAVDPSAFEFISENAQIALVHAFMQGLPEALGR